MVLCLGKSRGYVFSLTPLCFVFAVSDTASVCALNNKHTVCRRTSYLGGGGDLSVCFSLLFCLLFFLSLSREGSQNVSKERTNTIREEDDETMTFHDEAPSPSSTSSSSSSSNGEKTTRKKEKNNNHAARKKPAGLSLLSVPKEDDAAKEQQYRW